MESIPVGIDAVFMVDETKKIVDVNFASQEAAERVDQAFEDKAPLTETRQNIFGTSVKTFANNRVTIRQTTAFFHHKACAEGLFQSARYQ